MHPTDFCHPHHSYFLHPRFRVPMVRCTDESMCGHRGSGGSRRRHATQSKALSSPTRDRALRSASARSIGFRRWVLATVALEIERTSDTPVAFRRHASPFQVDSRGVRSAETTTVARS